MMYKRGDKVIVFKPKTTNDGVFYWSREMDKYIGKVLTIQTVSDRYYKVEENKFTWKEEWFEDPLLKLIDEVTK